MNLSHLFDEFIVQVGRKMFFKIHENYFQRISEKLFSHHDFLFKKKTFSISFEFVIKFYFQANSKFTLDDGLC